MQIFSYTSQHFTWLLALHWAAPLHCHWWRSVVKKMRNGELEEEAAAHTHTHFVKCSADVCADPLIGYLSELMPLFPPPFNINTC